MGEFKIIEFQDIIEIPYNATFQYNEGNVCYGNKFTCYEVNTKYEGEVNSNIIGLLSMLPPLFYFLANILTFSKA